MKSCQDIFYTIDWCPNCKSRFYINDCFINIISRHIYKDELENITAIYISVNHTKYVNAAIDCCHPKFRDKLDKLMLLI